MNDKITISLDDVNSSNVTMKITQDELIRRAEEHQEQVRKNIQFSGNNPATTGNSSNSIFYKAWCYLALFGLVFGFLAWGTSEVFMQVSEQEHGEAIERIEPKVKQFFEDNAETLKAQLQSGEITEKELDAKYNKLLIEYLGKDEDFQTISLVCIVLWYMFICSFIGFGLSSAEGFMDRNYSRAVIRGLIATGIGIVIGPIIGIVVVETLYNKLGGGSLENIAIQMFARTIGWGFMGCLVAITPGIVMKNSKKFGLGLAGGAIGGLLGGLFFDPISLLTHTAVLSRMIGIISFGVLAGLAMGLLEEAAKQGWLKVTAGVITGKQFIIYRNPTIIGSSPKSEIYLFKDTAVMPSHAAIHIREKSFVIESLDSNGIVYVNCQPISQRNLQNGDFITIGSTQFTFGTKDVQTP
jgi:hypothetical protein